MYQHDDMRVISKNILAGMTNARNSGVVISAVLGVIILLSIILDSAPQIPFLCLFHFVTGLPCPSCGMTRAFISLGHGNIYAAILFNPASILIYIATWVGFILALLQIICDKKFIEMIWDRCRRVLFPVILTIMTLAWACQLFNQFG